MLQSMTGYGRTEFALDEYQCIIEVRSLNGKQLELNVKIPPILKFYEIELRSKLQEWLIRGTIELSVQLKFHGNNKPVVVNTDLAKYYYDAIVQIADTLQLEKKDILSSLIRMPDIVSNVSETLEEKHWHTILTKTKEACDMLCTHRSNEGAMLSKTIINNIENIRKLCDDVNANDKNRIDKIRNRIQSSIEDFLQTGNADRNRMEQEIIYYIEKLDISEEKNRLMHHCDYFMELINEKNYTKGKKLGFVVQEIGREINTMGSKANDIDLQKIVVRMKDELEQTKEQLLNAL